MESWETFLAATAGSKRMGRRKATRSSTDCPWARGKARALRILDQRGEVVRVEAGHELVVGIVVVDAVGEPDAFNVGHELGPAGVVPVAFVARDDGLEGAADLEVVLVVLVEDDVPAADGGFAEVIDQFLLGRRQGLEPGHLVAEDPQVGELVDLPLELAAAGAAAAGWGDGSFFLHPTARPIDGDPEDEPERALDVHATEPPGWNSKETL